MILFDEALYEKEVFSKNLQIKKYQKFSTNNLNLVRDGIRKKAEAKNYKGDEIVAVFGSYAREEASELSDLDYLIISNNNKNYGIINDAVKETCEEMGIDYPNPDGVFAAMEKRENIIGAVGSKADNYDNMSRRMLFLLESKPLYNDACHSDFVREIINIYTQDIKYDFNKNYVYLMNDLIRYFRTICVNYAYTKDNDQLKWSIRNIKLRHSRVIMYASLICVLGTLSKYDKKDKTEVLTSLIKLTPIQRFYYSYNHSGDDNFFRIASIYNNFLYFINNKNHRGELFDIDYNRRYENETFSLLKSNSDTLLSEITRFIFANKGKWDDRFYEYLIL